MKECLIPRVYDIIQQIRVPGYAEDSPALSRLGAIELGVPNGLSTCWHTTVVSHIPATNTKIWGLQVRGTPSRHLDDLPKGLHPHCTQARADKLSLKACEEVFWLCGLCGQSQWLISDNADPNDPIYKEAQATEAVPNGYRCEHYVTPSSKVKVGECIS